MPTPEKPAQRIEKNKTSPKPMTEKELQAFREEVERAHAEREKKIAPIKKYFKTKEKLYESFKKFVILYFEVKNPGEKIGEKIEAQERKEQKKIPMIELADELFKAADGLPKHGEDPIKQILVASTNIRKFLETSKSSLTTTEYKDMEDFLNGLDKICGK